MQLTIYNTTVPVTDQSQANRLKYLCIEYGLPVWKVGFAFEFIPESNNFFSVSFGKKDFGIYDIDDGFTHITEQQFIELLKQTKP